MKVIQAQQGEPELDIIVVDSSNHELGEKQVVVIDNPNHKAPDGSRIDDGRLNYLPANT